MKTQQFRQQHADKTHLYSIQILDVIWVQFLEIDGF